MGPITYSLCQKPIIGLALWAASLCAVSPPFSGVPIDLAHSGTRMTKSFRVPVAKQYLLARTFQIASVEARLADQAVGDRFDRNCEGKIRYEDIPERERIGLGRPIPFRVVVRRAADRSVLVDETFVSLCLVSHDGHGAKTRTIGWLALPVGDYMAEVTNLQAQPALAAVGASISLYSGQGK